jgi:hypothetical protein
LRPAGLHLPRRHLRCREQDLEWEPELEVAARVRAKVLEREEVPEQE